MTRTIKIQRELLACVCAIACVPHLYAGTFKEFKIKRAQTFEFVEKPRVSRVGDLLQISFASKAACDATVVVENGAGRIIRHLASGVLGKDAPAPFKKNSLKQTLVWDAKDDAGNYVSGGGRYRVRVSLGLKARFEREYYNQPRKRETNRVPLIQATKEGVLVYDGGHSLDYLRLYDHKGDYLRTVYPFPASKVDKVKGLYWKTHPQDGKRLPIKSNFLQNTMLRSGSNGWQPTWDEKREAYNSTTGHEAHYGMFGRGASVMAVRDGRVALAHHRINWFGTDGTSKGMDLVGPKISYPVTLGTIHEFKGGTYPVAPKSAAFSADGKWLYLTGYRFGWAWHADGLQGLIRVPVGAGADAKPELFAGDMGQRARSKETGKFSYPYSVAVDTKNRVYVADYMNDRVQIFSPEGKVLKTISTPKPVHLAFHHQTRDLYVFSWCMRNDQLMNQISALHKAQKKHYIPATVTCYGPFENPVKKKTLALPLNKYNGSTRFYDRAGNGGHQYNVALDSHTEPPTIWLVPQGGWQHGIQLLQEEKGKLVVKRDFTKDVQTSGVTPRPLPNRRWRVYVNPHSGKAYLSEPIQEDGTGIGKAFKTLVEMDPTHGTLSRIELPFSAEDICFDLENRIYMRGNSFVGRYDFSNLHEVPWDYGEEQNHVGFGSSSLMKTAPAIAALPVFRRINWHMGGMWVNAKGSLAIACYGVGKTVETRKSTRKVSHDGKAYMPRLYPGRAIGGKRALIHVWDKHGQLLYEDALPGLGDLYGLGIDINDNLFVLSSATRHINGKRHFNDMSGTLLKVKPNRVKVITVGKTPVKLSEANRPKRPPEFSSAIQGTSWAQEADWFYGGVGYCGKNRGIGCACWNTRFTLDHLGRSFVPEMDRYSVAVLDTNGNLIMRVGTYGNADDGKPLFQNKQRHEGKPRSIGGDEVALFHAPYLATHTDRRLFIADPGNGRVVGVKLSYHVEETIPVKGVENIRKR